MPVPSDPPVAVTPAPFRTWALDVSDTAQSHDTRIAAVETKTADGDKGDITVSASGATWTIDPATVTVDKINATGTPSASTFLRGDGSWNTPGGGVAELLAVHKYAPASTTTLSAAGALIDLDATNLAVTFTAPASGKVIVRVSAFTDMNGGAGDGYLGLREATTNLAANRIMRAAAAEGFMSVPFYLTGISAGSHTYKLSGGTDTGTVRVVTGPGNALATFPPVLFEVWSAP